MKNEKQKQAPREELHHLPHSLEDEKYVISRMYYSVEEAEKILLQLELEHFFNKYNRKFFHLARELTSSGILVTSHSLAQEYVRVWDNPLDPSFDVMTAETVEELYRSKYNILDTDSKALAGAISRLKADYAYRQIIEKANEALLIARSRGLKPEEILNPMEELQNELQKRNSSVIVWMDEAEKGAQEMYSKLHKGEIVAVPTGFTDIDAGLYGGGFWGGDFVLVSGVTSGGKTTFELNAATQAAELGKKSLYFTLEMKTFKTFSRIHSSRAKIPGDLIIPNMKISTLRDLQESGELVRNLPIGFVDSVKDMDTISRIAKFAVRELGVDQIIIDYLGLCLPSLRYTGSRYEKNSVVSEKCKELAQFLNVPVVGLAQLRRKNTAETKGSQEEGNDIEPHLYMLKDSGQLENDADTVIFLWGEKGYEGEKAPLRHIYGKVAKQRNGKLFRFELKFAPDIFYFSSLQDLNKLRKQIGEVEF